MSRVGTNKVLASIDEAIEKAGVKDGMTLSFHHHLRNGDYVNENGYGTRSSERY